MSSSPSVRPSLLSTAGVAPPSRSAAAVVAKAARGFQLFRIDGYSLTTRLPGGERISSEPFAVGGRRWCVDYYPNGRDGSTDSDSDAIAVYLRLLHGGHGSSRRKKERVRADYKLSLLDAAGNAAYELPAETGIFVPAAGYGSSSDDDEEEEEEDSPRRRKKKKPSSRGYDAFVTKEDLRRRRESLLREDCLAIRCDVAVAEVETVAVGRLGQRRRRSFSYSSESSDSSESDEGASRGGRRGQTPADDKEYIRRCLASACASASSKRRKKERVRADYKFSLLDAAGNAAYELPAERGIFVAPSSHIYGQVAADDDDEGPTGKNPASCGHAAFITKEDLGRRRESLLREDSLAIRCDVGVAEVTAMAVGPTQQRNRRQQRICGGYSSDEGYEFDDEDGGGGGGGSSRGGRRGQPPPDDKEFIRRCLVTHRRKY
nr:unnamed protein product [Digitaria exilis]